MPLHGLSRANQQVDNFQTKVDSCTRPLAVSNFTRASQTTRLSCHCSAGFCLSASGSRSYCQSGRYRAAQHGGWRGANSRDDTPGTVERLTVSTSRVLSRKHSAPLMPQAARSRHIHRQPLRPAAHPPQLHAARAGNGQVAIAGDAGMVTLIPPRTKRSIVVTASVSHYQGRGKPVPMRSYSLSFLLPFQTGGCFPVRQSHARGRGEEKTIDIVDFGVAQRTDILQIDEIFSAVASITCIT